MLFIRMVKATKAIKAAKQNVSNQIRPYDTS